MVLDFLVSGKFLSNERFAEVRAHWLARKYGAAKIRDDLRRKGIPEELAARAAPAVDEVDKAKAILARKYREPATTREECAKRARFLQGRGFSADVIRRLVLEKV